MTPAEIALRVRRQLRFGAERFGLIGRHAPAPQWPPPGGIGGWPAPSIESADAYLAAAEELRSGTFAFFGRRFELAMPPRWNTDPATGTEAPMSFGKTIDYRDARVVGDAKFLWELNRHLELVVLAQSYRLTGDASHLDVLRRALLSWIEQCPYLQGPNWCSSLELGLRLINWHLAYCIAGGPESPLFGGSAGDAFRQQWLRSIYQHDYFITHHLSTYGSSANNHLIGELAGVFVSCCTWPCWPETDEWRRAAQRGLEEEIVRQNYADGVNKEQTTWYQQFVASLFLVAGLAGRRSGYEFSPAYWDRIASMIDFLSSVRDVSGNVPMIGDADDGIAFALEPRASLEPFGALLGVGAALYSDTRWRSQSSGAEATAAWLCAGVEPVADRADDLDGPRSFSQGGYYTLGRDLGLPHEVRALVDAGPLGFLSIASHGHADCLSMTLSVAGREQLIDPGTFAYHSGAEWRDYFRGTGAHNTVRIDGRNQSQIGGPFLWLDKAEAEVLSFDTGSERDELIATHTGYLRLDDPVRHTREIRFDKLGCEFEIVDRFDCRDAHRIERFWHFAETCEVALDGRSATSTDGRVKLRIDVEPDAGGSAECVRGSTNPIAGWVSRSFGVKHPTTTLICSDQIRGSAALRTRIRIEVETE